MTVATSSAVDQHAPGSASAPRYPPSPFPYGWFQFAYADEVGPGEVKPLHYLGREFVLWRDEEGTPHAMDGHCAHLGAHLGHGGKVEGVGIRCPFHAWKYDGTGRCVNAPYSDRINERARIRTYPIVDVNGFLMVWWHPEGVPPMWEVPEIPEFYDDGWTGYKRHGWRIATHWQEMVENAVDTSHFHYVHEAAEVPEITEFDADGHVLRARANHMLVTPAGPKPGFIDTIMVGPTWGTVRFQITGLVEILFPQALTPVDEGDLHAQFSFLVKGRGARAAIGDGLANEVIRQIDADVPIWEHKVYRPTPRLVPGDGPIVPFRRWAEQFYTGEGVAS
jgi:phenylpropionate dioxygenase-like ring-hydroxylating dioxygenase large terminal subunit